MNKKRAEAEALIYKTMDAVDKTKTNSDYYKKLFAKMSDEDFYNFFEKRLPLRFHMDTFKVEPKLHEINDAFKVLGKPLYEKVNMPHIYKAPDGTPIQSEECLVLYINVKRMKQMDTKKTHNSIDISNRDKFGSLVGEDKGGKETDREFETLAIAGLEYTMDEFARPKADAMDAMAQMANVISTQGFVSEKDLQIAKDDSIGKNAVNVYLLGAHIHSNLVDIDYMTPYTARNKQSKNRIDRMNQS